MRVAYYFVTVLARVLNLAILARVFMSWLPISRESPVIRIIYEITEPVLAPIRRLLPSMGGFDISPMLGLLLVQVIERALISILARVG